jgi:hypothetical protein
MERQVLVVPTRAMLWDGYAAQDSVYHAPGCRRVSEGAYLMPERVAQNLRHRPADCGCIGRAEEAHYESIGERWARESAEPRPRRRRS